MKKILLTITLLALTNSLLAYGTYSLDTKARKIASQASDLKPSVAKVAINALTNARKRGITTKDLITIIDYSLPSTTKRLWVIDTNKEEILYTSMVAHGKNSGENKTTKFSNIPNSRQTSIGLFITENTYFGRDGYSLIMNGLEKGFNDKAKSRYIVMHGAPYVSKDYIKRAGRLGRSWGCPAIEKELAKPIINTIKNGTLILAFYPDNNWLKKSQYLRG